jgi:formate--tetrahydrofolate ligase
LGYESLPVCMAKTPLSLSHDPALKGRPTGFTLPVTEVRLLAGAGFLTAVCSGMQLMPGLPKKPAGERIGLDPETGETVGLS